MTWIRVTDKLPPLEADGSYPGSCSSELVLVWQKDSGSSIASLVNDDTHDDNGIWLSGRAAELRDVTHWMPLPSPPQE